MRIRFLWLLLFASCAACVRVRAQFVLTKVADTATPIPNGSGNFVSFNAAGYGPATSQGSVVFYATGPNGQRGFYGQVGGVLGRIADTNTPAPGGANFASFGTFSYGFESDSLYFTGGNATQSGLYVSSNGVVTRLMDPNTVAPPGTNKFTSYLLAHPFDGRLAFLGAYGPATSSRCVRCSPTPRWQLPPHLPRLQAPLRRENFGPPASVERGAGGARRIRQ